MIQPTQHTIVLSEKVIRLFVSQIVVHTDYWEWFLQYHSNSDEPVVGTIGGGKRREDEKTYFRDFSSSDDDLDDLYILMPDFDNMSTGCTPRKNCCPALSALPYAFLRPASL